MYRLLVLQFFVSIYTVFESDLLHRRNGFDFDINIEWEFARLDAGTRRLRDREELKASVVSSDLLRRMHQKEVELLDSLPPHKLCSSPRSHPYS